MNILGIAVNVEVQSLWRRWLAPEMQPFYIDSLDRWPRSVPRGRSLSPELRHTYKTWRLDRSLETLWLDETTFLGMSRTQRAELVRTQVVHGRGAVPTVRRWSDLLDPMTLRAQADGHRFVWWPSTIASNPSKVLSRAVIAAPDGGASDALPSRHQEVSTVTWRRCTAILPGAKQIVGSFPRSSGPNCFGTIMAAAGVPGAAQESMLQAPFLSWLGSACQREGRDEEAGIVLVWRDGKGAPIHAAVTIGDGWALEKASAEWWTPSAIRSVADVIRMSRLRGHRLERHRILR